MEASAVIVTGNYACGQTPRPFLMTKKSGL